MGKLAIETAVRLGEQLVKDGLISTEQLIDALARQKELGGRLGNVLLEVGAIPSSALVHALARRLGVVGCVLRHGLIDPKVAKCLPREVAESLKVLPLFRIRNELTVAMAEPQSLPVQDRMERTP